ncbi:hypothetical protein EV424DRAFT_1350707 [Suillus variegatus]|nr:hypothetical protein EV424DRAFT_1350707 [Suillus variegatus]
MQATVFELLKTSDDQCAFIFKRQLSGGNRVFIVSSEEMNVALESGDDSTVYTESPSVIATVAVYEDCVEFNRIANLIQNDPATSVVYAESLELAQDLVHFAFTGERRD